MTTFVQFTTVWGKTVFINPEHVSVVTDSYCEIKGQHVKTTQIHLVGEEEDYFSVPFNTVEVLERLRGDL